MRQVRICRSNHIRHLRQELVAFNEWAEATPDRLADFRIIAETGNDLFGPQTHWIESRVLDRDREPPDQAVWTLVTSSLRAWLSGELAAHIAHYTEGAALITPAGSCHKGRGELLLIFEATLAQMPGLRLNIGRCDISYPVSNVAVVMLEGQFRYGPMTRPALWSCLQTLVFEAKRWQIAALQVFHQMEQKLELAAPSA